jgi:flagellar basal-body rod modification protein FlgD
MSTVNPLSSLDPAQLAGLSNVGESSAQKSETTPDVDKNDFLKLLVAQLEHQDPLSPIKNEAFIAQLATFSSLEQLIAIKQGIEKLVDATEILGHETADASQQAQV